MPKRNEGWAFHVHHDVLLEYCTDYKGRVDYIRSNKPADEQRLRLRLLKLVPLTKLPYDLVKSGEAWKAYGSAGKAYRPDLIKIHAELCKNCPWDGKTIFPGKEE